MRHFAVPRTDFTLTDSSAVHAVNSLPFADAAELLVRRTAAVADGMDSPADGEAAVRGARDLA